MNDFSELKEQATKLTRQIGLIRTGLGIDEISKKTEAIESEVGKLRRDNSRLTRENEELKDSLKSLISSVENSRLSDLLDSFQGVGKKLDAILETDRASAAPDTATTAARFGVVTDIGAVPREGQAEDSAANEPDKPKIPLGLRRGPD
jgi:FtsZ-binding cell division protein ZapB